MGRRGAAVRECGQRQDVPVAPVFTHLFLRDVAEKTQHIGEARR